MHNKRRISKMKYFGVNLGLDILVLISRRHLAEI